MTVIPFMPRISGVLSAQIGESMTVSHSHVNKHLNALAGYFDENEPTWKEIAEGAQIQAEQYAKHLAVANRAYDELAASYATLQRRNRELEKRDLSIAEVLMSFVNLFKRSEK